MRKGILLAVTTALLTSSVAFAGTGDKPLKQTCTQCHKVCTAKECATCCKKGKC